MKQKWWSFRALGLGVMLAASCGGGETNPLDPGTFSGMNVDKIRYDCMQTLQCRSERNESLLDSPLERCTEDTAAYLQAHPEKHMPFLENFSRCQAYASCPYLTCVQANTTTSYGHLQLDKVMYTCQQDVECRRQLNLLVNEITAELDNCIAMNVGMLDSFNPDQRTQFETEFTRCSGRLACDFANCFPF